MNRRQFIGVGMVGMLGGFAFNATMAQALPGKSHLFSAFDDADGKHFVARFALNEQDSLRKSPLPFRAHDVLPLDQQRVLAFGRRPQMQCAITNLQTGEQALIAASAGRHFYGHGCLSQHDSVLFTTENDYDAARGVIGLRDAKTLKPIGEYDSYGIGPHDIHLMPDGKTLVVANGGIQTHPDFGRRKLNIASMQPSLVYVDITTGNKLDEYRLDDHLLSIRHLSLSANGDVGIATQWQGNLHRQQPKSLVAWQTAGGELKALTAPKQAIKPLQGYMADLAYDTQHQILAVTSPRGNQVSFWNTQTDTFLQAVELPEPSGIAFMPEQDTFLISSAQGGLYTVAASPIPFAANPLQHFQDTQWDNHLVVS